MNRPDGIPVTHLQRVLIDAVTHDDEVSGSTLAQMTGIHAKQINEMLLMRRRGQLNHWQALLDAAGVEVVWRKKRTREGE